MMIDIKDLGWITRYNDMNITQAKYRIKLSNEIYIDKLLEEHDWLLNDETISNLPIPVKMNKVLIKEWNQLNHLFWKMTNKLYKFKWV